MCPGGGHLLRMMPRVWLEKISCYTGALSISVSAFTLCMGRRYSTPMHTSKGRIPIIRLGAGRLNLASCTAIPFLHMDRARRAL